MGQLERIVKWSFSAVALVSVVLMLSACAATAETESLVETVVVEQEGETVVETVIVESEGGSRESGGFDDMDTAEEEMAEAPASTDGASGVGGGEGDAAADEDSIPVPDVDDREFQTSLSAGEIDDNADFSAYQSYASTYRNLVGLGRIPDVNTSERHVIRVTTENGLPVLGAQVTLYDGEQNLVATFRTPASGAVYFHPYAYQPQADAYNVTVQKGSQTEGFELARANGTTWDVTLSTNPAQAPVQVDIMFLIDSTGSMSEEIAQLKDNILSISAQISALPSNPDVRFGMVTYRDRGDQYVTRSVDFTDDVQAFQSALQNVQAAGGGDTPEALNEGLNEAINDADWRVQNTVSLVFLVADAPPHLDRQEQVPSYAVTMVDATELGISVFPIASGGLDQQGEYIFRQIAQFTGGHFIFLTYEDEPQSSGEPGRDDVSVAEGSFTVEDLDVLVVRLVEEEIAQLFGEQ